MHALALLLAAAIQVTSVTWADAPPSMPKGTKMAVLEGSPKAAGMFTVRLKIPAGSVIAPHTHPRPERVTVLSGRIAVGFGTKVDKTHVKRFTTGGFYVNPPDEPHYLLIEKESVLQLTCEGPWVLEYVK
ncbi:MAG TPA: cupin domain-containing protein [Thermoanaerobaculia bacterium]|jgi:quercetin dioxygenase-like cupin family protein